MRDSQLAVRVCAPIRLRSSLRSCQTRGHCCQPPGARLNPGCRHPTKLQGGNLASKLLPGKVMCEDRLGAMRTGVRTGVAGGAILRRTSKSNVQVKHQCRNVHDGCQVWRRWLSTPAEHEGSWGGRRQNSSLQRCSVHLQHLCCGCNREGWRRRKENLAAPGEHGASVFFDRRCRTSCYGRYRQLSSALRRTGAPVLSAATCAPHALAAACCL